MAKLVAIMRVGVALMDRNIVCNQSCRGQTKTVVRSLLLTSTTYLRVSWIVKRRNLGLLKVVLVSEAKSRFSRMGVGGLCDAFVRKRDLGVIAEAVNQRRQ